MKRQSFRASRGRGEFIQTRVNSKERYNKSSTFTNKLRKRLSFRASRGRTITHTPLMSVCVCVWCLCVRDRARLRKLVWACARASMWRLSPSIPPLLGTDLRPCLKHFHRVHGLPRTSYFLNLGTFGPCFKYHLHFERHIQKYYFIVNLDILKTMYIPDYLYVIVHVINLNVNRYIVIIVC